MSPIEKTLNPAQSSALETVDRLWSTLRQQTPTMEPLVVIDKTNLGELDADVAICGGTLGIFIAVALQKQGHKVILLERGKLKGREQEWNISRPELQVFLDLELLSETELDQAIATEYNPARISFHQGYELWVKDVLNIGIDPIFLLETLKNKFLEAGGTLLEYTSFGSATIHPDGVCIQGSANTTIKTRLLIDAMGHFSSLVKQARQGEKPEGVCLVVGSCAQGYTQNQSGDLIVSFTPISHQCQYFWEAFPARDGRTTYLFTYLDTHRDRFSLKFLLEEYLRLLPEYQNIEISELQFARFLFGFFPSYRQSPLQMPWDRVIAVGDSSGSQSPVSFGGFGAMLRHLKRLTFALDEALKIDALSFPDLALIQPYQPGLSATWLFQKTMSVRMDREVDPQQINQLMSGVFQTMDRLGDDVLKPFLQDVLRLDSLSKTLPLVNPKVVLPLLPQLGINSLLDWSKHFLNLALYTGLYPVGKSLENILTELPQQQQYIYHRWLDRLKYGAGLDYEA
jgi:lycopene cyclase CruP